MRSRNLHINLTEFFHGQHRPTTSTPISSQTTLAKSKNLPSNTLTPIALENMCIDPQALNALVSKLQLHPTREDFEKVKILKRQCEFPI